MRERRYGGHTAAALRAALVGGASHTEQVMVELLDHVQEMQIEHDRRVTELLAANNAEVERRRAAENGSPQPIATAPRREGEHLLLCGDGPTWTRCWKVGFWYDGAWHWDRIGQTWEPTHWYPAPTLPREVV